MGGGCQCCRACWSSRQGAVDTRCCTRLLSTVVVTCVARLEQQDVASFSCSHWPDAESPPSSRTTLQTVTPVHKLPVVAADLKTATQGEEAPEFAGAQQAEAQTQLQTSSERQTRDKPTSAAASSQQAEADEGQTPAEPAPKRKTRRKAASAETAPGGQADAPAPPRRQTRRKAISQKAAAGEAPKRSRRKAATIESPTNT